MDLSLGFNPSTQEIGEESAPVPRGAEREAKGIGFKVRFRRDQPF
jgi:hypothetical protein